LEYHNEEIRKIPGRPAVRQVITSSRLRWLGRVFRVDNNWLPKQILKLQLTHGKQRPGWPHNMTYSSQMGRHHCVWSGRMAAGYRDRTGDSTRQEQRLVTTARAASLTNW